MKPADKLKGLISKSDVQTKKEVDKRILGDALEHLEKLELFQGQPNIWRIIVKSRVTKLAAAAVIIIVVLVGVHQFGRSVESVAWADVAGKVEQIQTFSCRLWTSMTSDSDERIIEAEIILYNSSEYGSRIDTYMDDKLLSTTYMPAGKLEAIMVVPEAKKYSRMLLTEEQLKQMREKQKDPREFIKLFLSVEYTELGRKTINGIQVEGIEVDSPKVGAGMFESAKGRLWVDVETDLPVRMEIEGLSGGGSIQQKIVMDEFRWDIEFDSGLFEPNIPADYTLMAEMKLSEVNEEMMVQGLHLFAEIADGRYPSSLAMMTATKELQDAWRQKYDRPPTNEELQIFMSLNAACQFYAQLVQEDKDVEYYGAKVTAEEADKVLMQWRISENECRVIYGDLKTETVMDKEEKSSEEKTLDRALEMGGKKPSTDERGLVMRMLSLNEADLLRGLGVFLELSGGQYPSSLDAKTTLPQTETLLKARYSEVKDAIRTQKESKEKVQDIFFASAYYEKLVRERKDVAYYGSKVTAEDGNKVLMRWKISVDKYRALFGDLTTKDVSAEELAELEKPLLE